MKYDVDIEEKKSIERIETFFSRENLTLDEEKQILKVEVIDSYDLFNKLLRFRKYDLIKKIISELLSEDDEENIHAYLSADVIKELKEYAVIDQNDELVLTHALKKLENNLNFLLTISNDDKKTFFNYLDDGYDINGAYATGYLIGKKTPLELAFSMGPQSVDFLLENGADIDICYSNNPYIVYSLFHTSSENLRKLLEHGANIEKSIYKILSQCFHNITKDLSDEIMFQDLKLLEEFGFDFRTLDLNRLNEMLGLLPMNSSREKLLNFLKRYDLDTELLTRVIKR